MNLEYKSKPELYRYLKQLLRDSKFKRTIKYRVSTKSSLIREIKIIKKKIRMREIPLGHLIRAVKHKIPEKFCTFKLYLKNLCQDLPTDIQNIIYRYLYGSMYSDVVDELEECFFYDREKWNDGEGLYFDEASRLYTIIEKLEMVIPINDN